MKASNYLIHIKLQATLLTCGNTMPPMRLGSGEKLKTCIVVSPWQWLQAAEPTSQM